MKPEEAVLAINRATSKIAVLRQANADLAAQLDAANFAVVSAQAAAEQLPSDLQQAIDNLGEALVDIPL